VFIMGNDDCHSLRWKSGRRFNTSRSSPHPDRSPRSPTSWRSFGSIDVSLGFVDANGCGPRRLALKSARRRRSAFPEPMRASRLLGPVLCLTGYLRSRGPAPGFLPGLPVPSRPDRHSMPHCYLTRSISASWSLTREIPGAAMPRPARRGRTDSLVAAAFRQQANCGLGDLIVRLGGSAALVAATGRFRIA